MTYDKKANYCTMAPDGLFNVNFNHACYIHDREYRNEVKVRKTRSQADADLRDEIYSYYLEANKKIIGYIVSRIYYIAVRLFAKRAWVV